MASIDTARSAREGPCRWPVTTRQQQPGPAPTPALPQTCERRPGLPAQTSKRYPGRKAHGSVGLKEDHDASYAGRMEKCWCSARRRGVMQLPFRTCVPVCRSSPARREPAGSTDLDEAQGLSGAKDDNEVANV